MRIRAIIAVCAVCLTGSAGADETVLSDFESLENWEGLIAETEVVHEGEQSGLWTNVPEQSSISYRGLRDWSEFKGISVWIHNQNANGQRIDLIAHSSTQGLDYFQHHIRLDWTGWRHFVFPFYAFGSIRRPAGWHRIDVFTLSATWMDEPREDTVMRLDDLRLTDDVPEPIGDLMTNRELIERLDLSREGMEPVRERAQQEQWDEAALVVLDYFRGVHERRVQTIPDAPRPDPDESYTTIGADHHLRHEFSFYNSGWHAVGDPIDWQANPVGDIEWPIALNRHGFVRTLVRAWWHTGDERYAREAADILRQWIAAAKVANVRSPTIHWRTLDTGIRLRIWPEVWLRLLRWEGTPDEVLVAMLKMFWHQAEYLMDYHGGGNWLVTEKAGLLKTALLLPEFTRSEAWESNALQTLTEQIQHQTYPSGAQFELTPHYHMVSMRSFSEPLHLMRINGRELPEVYHERLEAMHEYLLLVRKPDGRIPMLNDSDHGSVRNYMRDGAALFEREDMRFVATDGAEGTAPDFRSVALPWAGQYVMRSDWSPEARYLLFDAGPFGHGHQHEDKLCVDTRAFGQDMVIDPGRYTYAGEKWRRFFVQSESHNVVLVDGGGQRRHGRRDTYYADGPMPVRWASGEGFDYARGSYDGPFRGDSEPEVAHTRAIWFVKPDYWMIADFLRPADDATHEYEMLWHFAPGEAQADGSWARYAGANGGMLVRTSTDDVALEIIEGQEEPVQGWVAYDYGLKDPAPVASYRFEGTEAEAVTALYPFPGIEAPELTVERLEAEGGVAKRVTREGGSDVVAFRAPEAEELRWGDYSTDAEAFCVRLNGDGTVQSVAMAGGTGLTGPGLSLQVEDGADGAEWRGE